MVNRYSNAQTYQGQLYTPPLELVGQSLKFFQDQYDRNYELAETIKNNFIQSLPQDRELANQMQRDYASQIDNIVTKYGSDYSRASSDLKALTHKIQKDYGPGGKANAIISNYNSYKDWRKAQQELVEKGKALGQDLNVADTYYMNQYKGIGEFDPITGNYNRFNAETLSEYIDPDSIIQDVYKNFKPEKQKISRTEFKNGLQTQITEEIDGISASRLQPSFQTALANNPKYIAYLTQQAKLRGIPEEEIGTFVQQYAGRRAMDLSYQNKANEVRSERDPLSLIYTRHRLRQQENQELIQGLTSNYQYDPTTEVTNRKQSTITNDGDWKKSFSSRNSTLPYITMGTGMPGSYVPGTRTIANDKDKNPYDGKTFRQALNDPTYVAESRILKPLAEQIFEDKRLEYTKKGQAALFNTKYGYDKKWTEEFDREVAKAYKKEEASHSRVQTQSIPIESPAARTNNLRLLASRLADPSRVSAYIPGEGKIRQADELGLTRDALVDKDSGKLKYSDISYVLPDRGRPYSGFQVTTDKGTFVIVDQNTDRMNASKQIYSGLAPIFEQNQRYGNPMVIGDGVVGIPEIAFEKNRSGGYDENMYINILGSDGKPKERRSIGIQDLHDQYSQLFNSALGTGQTKAQATFFDLFPQRDEE